MLTARMPKHLLGGELKRQYNARRFWRKANRTSRFDRTAKEQRVSTVRRFFDRILQKPKAFLRRLNNPVQNQSR